MLLKPKSTKNERSGSREEREFFSRVKGDITTIREQGTPPEKDTGSFSRFRCDLCNGTFPLTELKQCTLCGRWACSSCWTTEYYICNSCSGIVRLHLIPAQQPGKPRN